MPDTIKITNDGELKYMAAGMVFAQKLGLFTNAITPGDTHVLANFTQPTYGGYAVKDLNNWPAPTTNGQGRASSTHPDVSFDYTNIATPVTVRGVFLYNPVDNKIMAVILYEFAETLSGNGSHIVSQTLQHYSAT